MAVGPVGPFLPSAPVPHLDAKMTQKTLEIRGQLFLSLQLEKTDQRTKRRRHVTAMRGH